MQTFVGKMMSLLFNMLSRVDIAFLPRREHLLISWLQSLSRVILESKKRKLSLSLLFPHLFAMKWQDWMPWFFLNVEFQQIQQIFSSFTLIKRLLFFFAFYHYVGIICILRLLLFLLTVLIPACDSSSSAFCMMYYSSCKGDNMAICSLDVLLSQFWTSLLFDVWFQLLFLGRHTGFSGDKKGDLVPTSKNFPQFVVIHTVKGISIVNEAKVDVFLKFPWFLYDPTNVGFFISVSSSKLLFPFLNSACTSVSSWFIRKVGND